MIMHIIKDAQDHPRIRGENSSSICSTKHFPGSPPHTRGKLVKNRRDQAVIRITPAYAGKTYMIKKMHWD